MKVVTTIVIAEEVKQGWEEQVRRNFNRVPVFGDTGAGIKKHLQKLIPTLTDQCIHIEFELEDDLSDETAETYKGREVFKALGEGKVLYYEDDHEQKPIYIDDSGQLVNAGYMDYTDLLGTWYSKPKK